MKRERWSVVPFFLALILGACVGTGLEVANAGGIDPLLKGQVRRLLVEFGLLGADGEPMVSESGWTDNGSTVTVTTAGDGVGVGGGTVSSAEILDITGDATRKSISVTGGAGAANTAGGTVGIAAGSGTGSGNGGAVTLTGGSTGTTGTTGGTVAIKAGTGNASSNAAGGVTSIGGGDGNGSGAGGSISVYGGHSQTEGDGSGTGGSVTIAGSNAGSAGNGNGGSVSITAGNKAGAGTAGSISLTPGAGGTVTIFGPTTGDSVQFSNPGGDNNVILSVGTTSGTIATQAHVTDRIDGTIAPADDDGSDLGDSTHGYRNLFLGAAGAFLDAGTASPEGSVTAPIGSIFTNTSGSTPGTVFYFKATGSGNTGWKSLAPITPWATASSPPTGAFNTNTTYTCIYRQVGDSIECEVEISFSGAPNAVSATIGLPDSLAFATAKMFTTFGGFFGTGMANDSGSLKGNIALYWNGSNLSLFYQNALTTWAAVTASTPFVIGAGDAIILRFSVPVTGF